MTSASKSKRGKVFVQDKGSLLRLAETISSGKELVTRRKVDRTKAAGASSDSLHEGKDKRRKKGSISGPEKLRAAKQQVTARQNRHKREKIKARKHQVQTLKDDSRRSGVSSASGEPFSRKRVSFA